MRRRGVSVAVAVALAVAAGCTGDDGGSSSSSALTIETTSTRPDAVTGGDVLVTVSGDAMGDDLVLRAGDRDVTEFGNIVDGRWTGLITELPEGEVTLSAEAGGESAELAVVNHPITGPIFSGPHLEPWVCTTEQLGLGEPTDDDCSAPTEITWWYEDGDGEIQGPVDDPADVPDGDGAVFRQEQGVIDRGVYWIWVPDPDPGAERWEPSEWNGRLVYRFGGGCGTSYSQGTPLGTGMDTDLLSRGYALATNTLNTFQNNCNAVLSAEAALMTHEHFAEDYAVPELTIGDGGSGGAVQQMLIGQNQPGLLDGLSASLPFPDAVSIAGGVTDCGLLVAYFADEGAGLTAEQQAAIAGNASAGTCRLWDTSFVEGVEPFQGCDGNIPAGRIYDPDTNPDGVRCSLADINVATLDVDPDTGFARRPVSNEGVQYGLRAFEDGVISAGEFVALNEDIGGYDVDGQIADERTTISAETAEHAYRIGAITGAGPLLDVPIILRQPYTDTGGDIHTRYHAFSIRERLQVDGEDDPNLALWTSPAPDDAVTAALTGSVGNNEPIFVLDQWLTENERPAEAANVCVLPDGTTIRGGWEIYDQPGPCQDTYPVAGDPRTAAGGPTTGDVILCALAPVDEIDADLDLSAGQLERLEAVFPNGVCDWEVPGVGVQPPDGEWQDFGD